MLTDLRMPGTDGLELAAAIADAVPGRPVPPVLLLSSVGDRLPAGAPVAGSLVKPVKPSALHDAIVTVLAGLAAPAPARSGSVSAFDSTLGARHPLRILLAEDNAVNQKLAQRMLERMGYTADTVRDGAQAVAAVGGGAYDVVLMDVQMPELDGLEATRRIRAGETGRRVHIVAMTANAMSEDREACLDAGMDDYVSKPIRPEALAAALERAGISSQEGRGAG